MAAPTLLKLVQNRLPTSHLLATNEATELQEFIDEAKIMKGFVDETGEPLDDDDLSRLELSYVADVAAIDFLNSRLNRYMEDAEVKTGGDGVTQEWAEKWKYIREQVGQLRKSAEEKAGQLGMSAGSMIAGMVTKITARDESEDDE